MWKYLSIVAAAAFSAAAAAPALDPSTALLENGPVKVTAGDFEAAMTRFPENIRLEARANPDNLLKMVDAMFVNRELARRAMELKIDQDPLVQERIVQLREAFLATKYLEYVEKNAKVPDLETRALELYKAEPQRFTEPPIASFSHILVGIEGRTRDMALERAMAVRKLLVDGADFAKTAGEYSDDPAYARTKGELRSVKQADLDSEIAGQAFAMSKVGEWSEPIPSRFGFHLLRLNERKEGGLRKFDDVKQALMDEEANRLRKHATEEVIESIRSDRNNVIHLDRIRALKSDIDPAMIDAAQRRAIEKLHDQ